MTVSKRLRYEVLRRDDHTCRYCGAKAPDVAITVDHVLPVALGGADTADNLVAACKDCNAGKSSASADSERVLQVVADAFRWAQAVEQVADDARRARRIYEPSIELFLEKWHDWTYGPPDNRQYVPMDGGWKNSLVAFLSRGLSLEDLFEFVDLAMGRQKVDAADTWRYFCGICWRAIGDLDERARELLAHEEQLQQAEAERQAELVALRRWLDDQEQHPEQQQKRAIPMVLLYAS